MIRMSNQSVILFTIADKNGDFELQIPAKYDKDSLSLKVSSIGFKKYVLHSFFIDQKNIIQLKLSEDSLPELLVKSQRLVVQKGDTLTYDAGKLKGKSDRYLIDLVKKMPGIQIDANGNILYQGKAINNFYIEGSDLLDDKYNIATDNIPADAIDKLQVIEHNQNVKMLNGRVPSDQAGMNIILNDKSRFRVIDNAELEGGTPNKWNGALHNMFFNDKLKAINEIKSNNIGIDYSDETGVAGLSNAPAGNPLFNKAVLLGINDQYNINRYKSLRINGYYIHDAQTEETQSSTTYFLPGNDTISYKERDKNHMPYDALNLQLDCNLNSPKAYFDNKMSFTQTKKSPETDIFTNGQNVLQRTDNTSAIFNNRLRGYRMFDKRHIIAFNSEVQYSSDPKNMLLVPGALPMNVNDSIPYIHTTQQIHAPAFSINNNIAFNDVFGHWFIGTNTGFGYLSRQFRSAVQLLDSSNSTKEPIGFSNRLHWQQAKLYFTPQISYQSHSNQLNILFPLSFTHINYHNDSIQSNTDKLNHLFINPTMSWQHKVGKENQTTLSYSFGQSTATIDQIYGGQIFTDYRTYSSYKMPLLTGNTQTIDAGFDFKKTLIALFGNFDVSYGRTENYFLDSISIQKNFTTLVALPINNQSNKISFSGNLSKYFYSLQTTVALNASFTHSTAQQLQNEALFDVHNKTTILSFNITPTILDWLDMKFSGQYSRNGTVLDIAGSSKQTSEQWNETSSMIIYPVKNLGINFDSRYLKSLQGGQNLSSIVLINAYVQYSFSSPATNKLQLRLSCNNIAGITSYQTISISNNIVNSYSYLIQPRTLLLSAHFDF